MAETGGYAVFLFPQAFEALGPAIQPYLADGPAGQYLPCLEIDTGGTLVQLTVAATTEDGKDLRITLMLPVAMIRLVLSQSSDARFGFGPRTSGS